jgi:hypothetical protein
MSWMSWVIVRCVSAGQMLSAVLHGLLALVVVVFLGPALLGTV